MTYTHGHHESVLRSHRWRTVDNSAAYVADHFVPGARVLDVGCGPGTITLDIAQRVAPGAVIGIDASADVIEQARRDAAGAGNVEFATGDVYALDFPDASFDVVHTHQMLQHVPDPVGALPRDAARLRPSGVVARATVTTPRSPGIPRSRPSTRGSRSTARSRARTGASPTPGASCSRGRMRPGSPRSRRRHRRGASPPPRIARGGAISGPIA